MNLETLLNALDPAQKQAATISRNAVIAAGAGSGKTRVLTTRFLYLLLEKQIPIDEIYALTFTQKAASEMFSRMYKSIAELAPENKIAREAFEQFEQAHIGTLDSLCNDIAKKACVRYGVAPNFTIDTKKSEQLATNLALPFFLKHRSSPAIKQLLKKYSITQLPFELFAKPMQEYSTISSPLNFKDFYICQKKEIERLFNPTAQNITQILNRINDLALEYLEISPSNKTSPLFIKILENDFELPHISNKQSILAFIQIYDSICSIPIRGKVTHASIVEIKEHQQQLRHVHSKNFSSLANWILNEEFLKESLDLLEEFQDEYLKSKRTSGILTFNDVSQMALDALIIDPDLRASYKNSISAIMIDEFQDNNQKQKDLLYLLAENLERREPSIPLVDELCPHKLFFVGDEKQSIYRFRGAEVSVFRQLSKELKGATEIEEFPELKTNYRSETRLLQAFNTIFPHVFLKETMANPLPLYEAGFSPISTSVQCEQLKPSIEILIINESNFATNESNQANLELDKHNTEAKIIAQKIRELKESGYLVYTDKQVRPCTWEDFAILCRSSTRQGLYEKYLREEGIPYQTDILKGLFDDAPINDMYALLRLATFPKDRTAYARVLNSPFVRLSSEGFTSVLLNQEAEPFSKDIETQLEMLDSKRYSIGRACYERLKGMIDSSPITELISHLWYTEGYRYAVINDPDLQRYTDLYDYFFELARMADDTNEPLANFLDTVAELIEKNEKVDGLDIPVEQTGGVKMMTIHKSKGLEFPIVFIVDAGNTGRNQNNSAPVYFSKEFGVSINTGQAENTEDKIDLKTNFFYLQDKEIEQQQAEAELRRLLYVAMTRAELKLVISGSLLLDEYNGEDEKGRNNEDLLEPIKNWVIKKEESISKNKDIGIITTKKSIWELLLPAFSWGLIPDCSISEIMPMHINTLQSQDSKTNLILNDKNALETVHLIQTKDRIQAPRIKYSATSIRELQNKDYESDLTKEFTFKSEVPEGSKDFDSLDKKLDVLGMKAHEYGTLMHTILESSFTGVPYTIPQELESETHTMLNLFYTSELGQKVTQASWRETEFSFITKYSINNEDLIVTGQIDLLFEYNDTLYLVDYKTDKQENPEIHIDQLNVYKKAVSDLYPNKQIKSWLFYLRTGRALLVHI